MRENRAKHKLQDGKRVAVAFGDNTPDMIDFLGPLGFDAIRIEMEHGSPTWSELSDMSRACDLWGMSSIARVPDNVPWLISRTLDLGVQGVIVPHVNTKEEALRVVDAAKFAPIGHRGTGGGRQGYGVTDYLLKANDESIVVAMVEDIVGIRNLADILTVDNIDVFVVARSDLSHSMGYLGQLHHPEVAAVYDKAVAQIVASGRSAGVQVTDSDVDKYIDMGVRYLSTTWSHWIRAGASRFLQKVTEK
ncbi:MAG: aldolase/citrate lyase family protein [Dehalococcoidia bacterium]|nr:aldolase/citrate lyase family protein [Dehalococcoidia bacterium]